MRPAPANVNLYSGAGIGDVKTARRRQVWTSRAVAVAVSLGGHLAILLAIIWARSEPMKLPSLEGPGPISVALIKGPQFEALLAPPIPTPEPKPVPKPQPPHPKASPKPVQPQKARQAPPAPNSRYAPTSEASASDTSVSPSESQLAQASTASSGSPGGECNMIRLLQDALRKDASIRSAVAEADRRTGGRAIMLWNGDWVTSRGEDGKGLANVREVMMVEIAFAPAACKTGVMHGLVLFSLNDGPGATRLTMGSGVWRWSDLLVPHPGA
jgi:hypothetical protein